MSKKKAYRHRSRRVRWSVAFFVLALLLTFSEVEALRNLSRDPTRDITGLEQFNYWVSLLTVAATLSIVISLPVSSLVASTLGDVTRWLEVNLPWSKVQKLRRDIERQLTSIELLERRSQSSRLSAILVCATALLDRSISGSSWQAAFATSLSDKSGLYFTDPTGELKRLVHSDPREPLWAYRVARWLYDDLLTDAQELRELRKQIRAQLRRLEKITRVDSSEFTKLQRANMASAARMP
ncbi:hypothetical protein SOM10_08735 [Microbacterium sp. CFBP9023]|uniref:hypothetical protein n=1 Tax=Microbacterium sp. CFBP9023 TaxID=3096535 RepID=UPI002A69DD55|nr:hypothetical protein [Microbacterium sp. CFBP9023]MDY0983976.1 hypothetical protein [Microbacterium sp. CFBP9023]